MSKPNSSPPRAAISVQPNRYSVKPEREPFPVAVAARVSCVSTSWLGHRCQQQDGPGSQEPRKDGLLFVSEGVNVVGHDQFQRYLDVFFDGMAVEMFVEPLGCNTTDLPGELD